MGQLAPRMPVTSNHSRSAERARWADCLKGIAILLVVVGHVIGGLRDSAILANSPTVSYVYDWIYAFHMPAFFFVAGAFAAGSLRRGLARFLVKKVGVLLYPYFLWALLGWWAALVMATYVNAKPKPLTLANALQFFAQLVYSPAGPWFLYALFWVLLLFGTLATLQVKPRWFLLFAALLFAAHALGYFGFSKELDLVSNYLIYFALGVVLAERAKSLALVDRPATLIAVGVACFTLMSVSLYWLDHQSPWLKFPYAGLGVVGLYGLCVPLVRFSWLSFLQQWGRHSLEIYLAHPFPSVFARVVLISAFGIRIPELHLLCGIALGVLVPVILARISEGTILEYLFRWEGKLSRHSKLARLETAAPLVLQS
jgi:fucose 4-O-acetylase-like acetyltransferase